MSLMQTIKNNVVVTDPKQTDIAYDIGFLSATYTFTRSWRVTGYVAAALGAAEVVSNVVIPTLQPLVVRGWTAMKEAVSTRSCCASAQSQSASAPA